MTLTRRLSLRVMMRPRSSLSCRRQCARSRSSSRLARAERICACSPPGLPDVEHVEASETSVESVVSRDVVDAIATTPVGPGDRPVTDVGITSVTIEQ